MLILHPPHPSRHRCPTKPLSLILKGAVAVVRMSVLLSPAGMAYIASNYYSFIASSIHGFL